MKPLQYLHTFHPPPDTHTHTHHSHVCVWKGCSCLSICHTLMNAIHRMLMESRHFFSDMSFVSTHESALCAQHQDNLAPLNITSQRFSGMALHNALYWRTATGEAKLATPWKPSASNPTSNWLVNMQYCTSSVVRQVHGCQFVPFCFMSSILVCQRCYD